ncbi:hypothetical protein COMA2_280009 [Candidatus Nitrospira nitrificans]|uniref:Uncharacterized protein n=1 Tax=Candidatus Nitrospira nitrificans TaxID=1742973 RepID=A0A0S4LLP6_9BACT|nr:hypothetical protein COMA2_280009 [Candidatus Nitrospira nitrificans]
MESAKGGVLIGRHVPMYCNGSTAPTSPDKRVIDVGAPIQVMSHRRGDSMHFSTYPLIMEVRYAGWPISETDREKLREACSRAQRESVELSPL